MDLHHLLKLMIEVMLPISLLGRHRFVAVRRTAVSVALPVALWTRDA